MGVYSFWETRRLAPGSIYNPAVSELAQLTDSQRRRIPLSG
jgi:hypothetical protein